MVSLFLFLFSPSLFDVLFLFSKFYSAWEINIKNMEPESEEEEDDDERRERGEKKNRG